MDSGTGQQVPSVGALVAVRGRKWVVGDVEQAAASTCVTLQSVEDGEYGRTLDVIWEVEPGRLVLPSGSLPEVAQRGFDPPERLAAFLDAPPDPAHLERVRTQLRAARIYQQDSAHGRAYDYGQGLATGLSVQDVNDWPDILAAVTAEDVMEAARAVLGSEATVTGWLLPPAADATPTPAAAPEAPAPTDTPIPEVQG